MDSSGLSKSSVNPSSRSQVNGLCFAITKLLKDDSKQGTLHLVPKDKSPGEMSECDQGVRLSSRRAAQKIKHYQIAKKAAIAVV